MKSTMKVYLDQFYGTLKPSVAYEVIEEGKDFYLLKNGMYVPKNIAKEASEVVRQEEYDYFAEDDDDY